MQKLTLNILVKKLLTRLDFQKNKILNSVEDDFANDEVKYYDSHIAGIYIKEFISKKLSSEKNKAFELQKKISKNTLDTIQFKIDECIWLSTLNYEFLNTTQYTATKEQIHEVSNIKELLNSSKEEKKSFLSNNPIDLMRQSAMNGNDISFFGIEDESALENNETFPSTVYHFPRPHLKTKHREAIIRDINEQAFNYHLAKSPQGNSANFKGATVSEDNLIDMVRDSFCNYWTIPNPFKVCGQELCDVLIIYKNNIIIFSDKERDSNEIVFDQDHLKIEQKWKTFYTQLRSSKRQLKEAKDWIINNPTEIYFDKNATQRVFVDITNFAELKFHLITTISNWSEVSKLYLGKQGNLLIDSSPHPQNNKKKLTLPNAYDNGNFLHMFDDLSFKILLKEIDTLPDFVDYLSERERFFIECNTNNIIIKSDGELPLLGQYLLNVYDYPCNINMFFDKEHLSNSNYDFKDNLFEIAKQSKDEINFDKKKEKSYLIDSFITNFTTVGSRKNGFQNVNDQEKAIRQAMEFLVGTSRSKRIHLSEAIYDFFNNIPDKTSMFRTFILLEDNGINDGQIFIFYICFNEDINYIDKMEYIKVRQIEKKLNKLLIEGLNISQNNVNINIKPEKITNIIFIAFDHPLGLKTGSETYYIYDNTME